VAIGKQDLQTIPVSVVMTRMPNIITCDPEESLYDAAKKLIDYQIDALPVVRETEEGSKALEVIGRVTKTTITKAYVELGSMLNI
jgi:CBS domain-containing protein